MTITDMAWIGLLTSILIGGYVVPLIQRRRQDGQQEHHEEVDVRQSPSGRRNYEGKVPPTQPTTVNVTTQPIRHQIPRTWVSSHPYYPRAIRRHVVKMAPPKPVSLWQERGWKQQRGWWEGTYVVNGRRWRGRAQTMLGGSLSFYIHKPPTPLLRGKHGACYVHKGKDKGYFVHFDPKKAAKSIAGNWGYRVPTGGGGIGRGLGWVMADMNVWSLFEIYPLAGITFKNF